MTYANVRFPDPLWLEYVGGEEWALLRPFRCLWSEGAAARMVEVPHGFRNDLSSIPRAARSLIPVVGPQNLPSVVHDYLYALRGQLPDGTTYTRKQADRLFLAGLKAAGVGWLKRRAMYAAVRAGGWWAWRT